MTTFFKPRGDCAGRPANAAGRRLSGLFPAGSLRGRFARGAAWAALGTAASQSLALGAAVARARLLGVAGYGELGMIQTTLGMFGVFAGLGLGMTAAKHIAEYRLKDPARAGRIVSLGTRTAFVSGLGFTMAGLALSPLLARVALRAPHLAFDLQLGCGLLLTGALTGAQNGILAGLEAFRALAVSNLCAGLLNCTVALAGVYYWGMPGAVGGLVAAGAATWAINIPLVRRELARAGIPRGVRPEWTERRLLWTYALPALASQALFVPTAFILNAMLAGRPGGFAELGLFSATQSWLQVILFMPNLVSQTTLPLLASLWGEGRLRDYGRLLAVNVILLGGLALTMALPLAAASGWLMRVYGQGFGAGARVLAVVCFYGVLWAVMIPVGQAIWSVGAVGAGMFLALLRLVLLVFFFRIFIERGALGMALAYTAAYLVQLVYVIPWIAWRVWREASGRSRPRLSAAAAEALP